MDIFFIFREANRVYRMLLQDDPAADLSVPGFSSGFTTDEIPMEVKVSPHEGRTKSVEEDTPLRKYEQMPKILKGSYQDVEMKVKAFIEGLYGLGATFYQEFASLLEEIFVMLGPDQRVAAFAMAFNSVLQKYCKSEENFLPRIQVRVTLQHPASISCYFQEKNCNAIFRFSTQTIHLTGFAEKELVDTSPFSQEVIPSKAINVIEDIIMESATHALLNFPSLVRGCRLDESDPFLETTDDILDSIVQKLVIIDAIDALQDIILDENVIYLCFDPCVEQDEMDGILPVIKQAYPQARLTHVPDGKDCPWWIIEVSRVVGVATQVINAPISDNSPQMGKDGVMAKPGQEPISDLIGGLDVNQALSAIGKG